jgi:hypothetical protein
MALLLVAAITGIGIYAITLDTSNGSPPAAYVCGETGTWFNSVSYHTFGDAEDNQLHGTDANPQGFDGEIRFLTFGDYSGFDVISKVTAAENLIAWFNAVHPAYMSDWGSWSNISFEMGFFANMRLSYDPDDPTTTHVWSGQISWYNHNSPELRGACVPLLFNMNATTGDILDIMYFPPLDFYELVSEERID